MKSLHEQHIYEKSGLENKLLDLTNRLQSTSQEQKKQRVTMKSKEEEKQQALKET